MSCVHCTRTSKLLDSFVTQEDKEEMVTDTIEEPVSLGCWLFYRVGYHLFLVSLRYKRIKQFRSPGAMNAQHGVPGSPAIYSPLYPRLVLSLCYQD